MSIKLSRNVVKSFLRKGKDNETDKDSRGRIYIMAGSRQMPGPAILSARAALRSGAGKVQIAIIEPAALPVAVNLPEARVLAISEQEPDIYSITDVNKHLQFAKQANVILIGPGINGNEHNLEFIIEILKGISPGTPVILDAAALPLVKESSILNLHKKNIIITPHPGEMQQLTGHSLDHIKNNLLDIASEFSNKFQCITVLKDNKTIISAPHSESFVHIKGTPALATAGSGDSLAGITAGLIAYTKSLQQAAALAVYAHGKTGKELEKKYGNGFLASDLIKNIPFVLKKLSVY